MKKMLRNTAVFMLLILILVLTSGGIVGARGETSTLTISQAAEDPGNASQPVNFFTFRLELFSLEMCTINGMVRWMYDYDNNHNTRPDVVVVKLFQNGDYYRSVNIANTDECPFEFIAPAKDAMGVPYVYTVDQERSHFYQTRIEGYVIINQLLTRSQPEPEMSTDQERSTTGITPFAVPNTGQVPTDLPNAELTRLQAISSLNFTVEGTGVYTFTLAPGQQIEILLDARYEFIVTQISGSRNGVNVVLDELLPFATIENAADQTVAYPAVSGRMFEDTDVVVIFNYAFVAPSTPPDVPATGDIANSWPYMLLTASFLLMSAAVMYRKRRIS